MGVFTFCVAATLVAVQTTVILLGRVEDGWSFQLVHAAPDSERWRPQLEQLLPQLSHHGGGASSGRNNDSTTVTVQIEAMMATAPPAAVVCLQGLLVLGASSSSSSNEWAAYQCLVHGHTPRLASPVLAPWNPHLLLMVLCGMQTLLAFARARHNRLRRSASASSSSSDADGMTMMTTELPITFIAATLVLMLLACVAVQGARDLRLIHYPTLLSVASALAAMVWFFWVQQQQQQQRMVDEDEDEAHWQLWCMLFHMQAVSIPTAALAMALLGSRVWADVLSVFCLLHGAVNLLWLGRPAPAALLLLACAYVMRAQFGPFDAWRYAWGYLSCAGLLPLLLLWPLLLNGDNNNKGLKQAAGLSMTTANVALIALLICLNQFQ